VLLVAEHPGALPGESAPSFPQLAHQNLMRSSASYQSTPKPDAQQRILQLAHQNLMRSSASYQSAPKSYFAIFD
jgi:hypothetical protein